jgi:ribonuclease P protein component
MVLHLLTGSTPAERRGHHEAASAPLVGFVVSKAVGNAVARNRVKRRLRHLVRARLTALPGDGVLVVRALPAAAEASSARLARDLETALHRLVADPSTVPVSAT